MHNVIIFHNTSTLCVQVELCSGPANHQYSPPLCSFTFTFDRHIQVIFRLPKISLFFGIIFSSIIPYNYSNDFARMAQ